jgi:glycosyltransferase involved in cell wall biosynthesis
MPAYNRAEYVAEAVRSVLAQTFTDLELIIIDDGSTDATLAVVQQFTDPRVHIIHQANQGISGALNTGLGAARGEYAIRLDSDDRFLPGCLARLVPVAEANPNAVLVYGRAQAMDQTGALLAQITGNPEPFPGQTLRSILYGDFVATITALMRRRALDAAGWFDTRLRGNEDWDLWIRLAGQGPFIFVDEALAEFRIHPTRFTAARGDGLARLMAGRLAILDKAFAQPELPADVLAVRPLAYRNVYVDAGLRHLALAQWWPALAAFRQALRYGNWLMTLARIVYLAVFYRLVARHDWVRALSDEVFRWKRSWRGRLASHRARPPLLL